MAESEPIGTALDQASSSTAWRKAFFIALDEELRQNRPFRQYLETCVRCGMCGDKCPVFLGTGDPAEMPPERAKWVRELATGFPGRFLPRSIREKGLDKNRVFNWLYSYYRCLGCRRCAVFCPMGIDTSVISLGAKRILSSAGLTGLFPGEDLSEPTYAMDTDDWLEAAANLEREIFDETGVAVQVPVDQAGCDVLLAGVESDMFTHTGTMAGYAKMFRVAGVSWTVSSHLAKPDLEAMMVEGGDSDFGLELLENAIETLRPGLVVWGETGLEWSLIKRVFESDPDKMSRFGFLKRKMPVHVHEFVSELLEKGTFKGRLDPEANRDAKATYHDPCHPARGGGLVEEPRNILRACVNDFREMDDSGIRGRTLCCGAGCSRRVDETLMTDGGHARMTAFRDSGADVLATACDVCKDTLAWQLKGRGKKKARIVGVLELFGAALTPYLKDLTGKGDRT